MWAIAITTKARSFGIGAGITCGCPVIGTAITIGCVAITNAAVTGTTDISEPITAGIIMTTTVIIIIN